MEEYLEHQLDNDEMARPFTRDDVKAALKKTKNHSAPGPDGVTTHIIKILFKAFPDKITAMFNHLWSTGEIPPQWMVSYITPLYKKGDPTDPGNYRGLALSSCWLKVLNSMINARMHKFMKDAGPSHNFQNGFKSGARTTDNILVLQTLIDKYKRTNQRIYAALIDIKKAYDNVDRVLLLHTLMEAKASPVLVKYLATLFDKVIYFVKTDGIFTSVFEAVVGLRQGDPLSPLLFNIYIASIIDRLRTVEGAPDVMGYRIPYLGFTDDMALLNLSLEGLQELIYLAEDYLGERPLVIHPLKSSVISLAHPIAEGLVPLNCGGIDRYPVQH